MSETKENVEVTIETPTVTDPLHIEHMRKIEDLDNRCKALELRMSDTEDMLMRLPEEIISDIGIGLEEMEAAEDVVIEEKKEEEKETKEEEIRGKEEPEPAIAPRSRIRHWG